MRALKSICCAAALVAFLAPAAHADEWNKRTYLTFSGPVQIPGATLPAGTYTFEIANPDTTRHVIRVSEKDSGKPIGLFMTIPNDRRDPPSDNLIMFSERAAGAPQAIQVWFYPGDRTGEEFVYPKNQAVAIAKANHNRVLATDKDTNANDTEEHRMTAMKGASVGRVDESGNMTSADDKKVETTTARNNAEAQQPAAATTTTAGAATTTTAKSTTSPKATTAPRADTRAKADTTTSQNRQTVGTSGSARRRALPRTASNLAAIELLSVLSLAGAFGVRRVRRADAR
jgi:hypothetical protein